MQQKFINGICISYDSHCPKYDRPAANIVANGYLSNFNALPCKFIMILTKWNEQCRVCIATKKYKECLYTWIMSCKKWISKASKVEEIKWHTEKNSFEISR